MALILDIADAVVAVLAAAPLELSAVRAYRPCFDLAELKTLRISVVPRGIEITGATRQANQHDVLIDVALQQKVELADTPALDGLMAQVQQIAGALRFGKLDLADGTVARWIKTENTPIYSPEHLESKQVFTSVLTVTYRMVG